MKKSKFSEAQIAFILRQADEGAPVAEVCRKAGISDATFYNWRKRYGGMTPSEVKRMRQLEDEKKLSREEAAKWLHQLADTLERHNQVAFVQKGLPIKIKVPDEVTMEVEVEIGEENSLEIEISW